MSKKGKRLFTCPLCSSSLSREKYLQIIGVWEERGKLETSLKAEMRKLQQERVNLRNEKKKMRPR
jgi:hypothetical protein